MRRRRGAGVEGDTREKRVVRERKMNHGRQKKRVELRKARKGQVTKTHEWTEKYPVFYYRTNELRMQTTDGLGEVKGM